MLPFRSLIRVTTRYGRVAACQSHVGGWSATIHRPQCDAAAEFLVWFKTPDLTTANDHSGVRDDGRSLIDMSARFLQHRAARTLSASNAIDESITAVMRDANEYMKADNRRELRSSTSDLELTSRRSRRGALPVCKARKRAVSPDQ